MGKTRYGSIQVCKRAALNNEEIEIYNNGKMIRDFTYIDDIVKGVLKVIENPAEENIDWKKDEVSNK